MIELRNYKRMHAGVLKSDLTGDDNLVPKMGLVPQCTIYIAEIIRRAL